MRGGLLSCLIERVGGARRPVILRGDFESDCDLRFYSRFTVTKLGVTGSQEARQTINTSSSSFSRLRRPSVSRSFLRSILDWPRGAPCGSRAMSPARLSTSESCCSRTERVCWVLATWAPVSIVYGATTWAVYVNTYLLAISFVKGPKGITL